MTSTGADIANSPKSMGHQLEKIATAVFISLGQYNGKVDDFAQAAALQSQQVTQTQWRFSSGPTKRTHQRSLIRVEKA